MKKFAYLLGDTFSYLLICSLACCPVLTFTAHGLLVRLVAIFITL